MADNEQLRANVINALTEYLHANGAATADQQVASCIVALRLESAYDSSEAYRTTALVGNTAEASGLAMFAGNFFGATMMGAE